MLYMCRKTQLQLNVEEVLDLYLNGMYDYPEEYPEFCPLHHTF